MAAKTLLPMDDLHLEADDVDGLIEVSTVGRGKKKASISSTAAAEVAGLCNSRYRARWGCLLLVVSAVVAIMWLADTSDLQSAVGIGGSRIINVEGKNVTHVEPINDSSVATDEVTKAGSVPATETPPVKDATEAKETATDASVTVDSSPEVPSKDTAAKAPDVDKDSAATVETQETTPANDDTPKTLAVDKGAAATTQTQETPVKDTAAETPDAIPPETPDAKDAAAKTPVDTEINDQKDTEETTNATPETPAKDTSATTDASPETPAKDAAVKTPVETATSTTDASRDPRLPKPYTVRTENPPSPAVLEEYAKTWGTWQLGELPKMDRDAFCGTQSHCDVPRDKFPPNAWQSDSAYMEKFLDEADKLVDRAMHAILAEYGKEPTDSAMFDLSYQEFGRRDLRGRGPPDNGGWTTKRSMQGLARRLLHAMMTRDTFTFIMGGHSAAAGHG